MNTTKIFSALLIAVLPITAIAQTNEQKNEARRQYYYNYSNWTVGIGSGLSAMFGDFSTFSYEKFYPAPIGSVSVGYQMNPTVGFTIEGYYGRNRIGALAANRDNYLNTNGFRADGGIDPLTGATFLKYGDLYSDVKLLQGRLGVDLNLSNIFGGNRGEQMRGLSVIFSPSWYLQYYRPCVFQKSNDARYTSRDLFYQVTNALGAELALRLRVSRIIDLQFKGGGAYGFNKKFDGIAGDKKTNILAYAQAGIIFKLSGKTKRDNILYAATPAYVPMPAATPKETVVQHDTVYVERIVERVVTKEAEPEVEQVAEQETKQSGLTNSETILPCIGFRRDRADIDEKLYSSQLEEIVRFLKENPDVELEIYGWADHTGTEKVNLRISAQRAENLSNYLVRHGINASRIKSVIGKGKDTKFSGSDVFSVKARRAEVMTR